MLACSCQKVLQKCCCDAKFCRLWSFIAINIKVDREVPFLLTNSSTDLPANKLTCLQTDFFAYWHICILTHLHKNIKNNEIESCMGCPIIFFQYSFKIGKIAFDKVFAYVTSNKIVFVEMIKFIHSANMLRVSNWRRVV